MQYRQHVTHTVITDTDREVELTFEPYPCDDILVHETPDHTVVAYLTLDFDPENPMKAFDGQGALRDKSTWEREGRGSDTDTDPFRVPVYWCDSAHGPGTATFHLTDSAETANKFWFPDECAEQNIRASALPEGVEVKQMLTQGAEWPAALYGLFVEGEQGARFVAPWADVWQRAFTLFPVTDETLRYRARQYAKGVLEEYRDYCNGDVYGVVVELFDRQGERIEEESVWGHYGYDYAKEALTEAFESKQKSLNQKGD